MNPALPPGWTVLHEAREVATEDAASAFTDGMQWTVRDPDGQRPPQGEWPTAWHDHAVRYAWSVAARRAAVAESEPPYAPSPAALNMLPRQEREPVAPMFLRRWQRDGETVHPQDQEEQAPESAATVLFSRTIDYIPALITLCPPAKLALGVKKSFLEGSSLGPGWAWIARHGAGYEPATGRFAESVALKLAHPDGRSALFVWARPVPDPRLMLALGVLFAPDAWVTAWMTLAALALTKAPTWKAVGVWRWTRDADGRPNDTPKRSGSAMVKEELRT